MTTFYKFINWILLFGYWLIIAVVTLRILVKRRAVTSAMAWLLVIYILPLVGIIAYLSFGELYLGKRRAERARTMWSYTAKWLQDIYQYNNIYTTKHSDVAKSLFDLCRHRQGIAGVKGNKLQLLTNTDNVMNTLIKDIQLARHNIEMVFYIWHPGGLADVIAKSLIDASHRGVHCRLMLDSAGSVVFFQSSWAEKMRNAGINVVEALQVSLLRVFFRRMDLRQHRKVVLIDNCIAYTGSMNLADPRFFKQNSGVGQWVDLMVRMEGPVTTTIGIVYACDWELETGQRILPSPPKYNISSFEKDNDPAIHVIASGPGFSEDIIHPALLTAVYSAREQLIITTPYFVPSDDLLLAICTAAQRGVEVNVIVPLYNDSILVDWASRAFFTELLESGVKIYQFKDGLLHTKSMLIDQQLSLVGTVNLDMRSLWLNFEIMIVVDDNDFGHDLSIIQSHYIAHSRLLDSTCWVNRAWWKRIIERLFSFFSPLL